MSFLHSGQETYRTARRVESEGRGATVAIMAATAPRSSRLAQRSAKTPPSTQVLAHAGHSCNGVAPTRTKSMSVVHPGQASGLLSSVSARMPFVPHCGQNAMPTNIGLKHDGQAIADSVEPQ
jgi:hypothetical protein